MRGKTGFAKAVKSVVLKTAERKWKSCDSPANSAYDVAFGGYSLNHNSTVEFTLSNNNAPNPSTHITAISQGVSDLTRNGSSIYSTGIMLRGSIVIPADRKNTTFKLYLLEYNTAQGDPTVYADLYTNITGRNMLDPFQPDRWKPKYLGTYTYKAHDTASTILEGQRADIIFKKWIPFKRMFHYQGDGSTVVARGIKERLSLLIKTFDNNSALDTSTCGYVRINATLHFKDP